MVVVLVKWLHKISAMVSCIILSIKTQLPPQNQISGRLKFSFATIDRPHAMPKTAPAPPPPPFGSKPFLSSKVFSRVESKVFQ